MDISSEVIVRIGSFIKLFQEIARISQGNTCGHVVSSNVALYRPPNYLNNNFITSASCFFANLAVFFRPVAPPLFKWIRLFDVGIISFLSCLVFKKTFLFLITIFLFFSYYLYHSYYFV